MRRILEASQLAHAQIITSNRPYFLPEFLVNESDKLWLEIVSRAAISGREVWNGPIYRLESDTFDPLNPSLILGLIDFKAYFTSGFLDDQIAQLAFSKRPNGMFVSGYLETSDKFLIFGAKSSNSILPFDINFVGGTLSPDDEVIQSSDDFALALFREINEEVGLDSSHIESIKPLGIWETNKYKIGVYLHASLRLSLDEFIEISMPNDEHTSFLLFKTENAQQLLLASGKKANPMIFATLDALGEPPPNY